MNGVCNMVSSLVSSLVDGSRKPPRGRHSARGSGFAATAAMMSLLFVCEASATTYYVDKATGSDSRGYLDLDGLGDDRQSQCHPPGGRYGVCPGRDV